MNVRPSKTLIFLALTFWSVLVIGCNSKAHNRTEVSGVVTLDGKPLPVGLTVKFTPQEPDRSVGGGMVGPGGRYVIFGEPGKIGLDPGTYVVSVELPFADERGPYTGPPELAKLTIPEAYQTGKSTLTYTAPSGGGTLDIEMSSK